MSAPANRVLKVVAGCVAAVSVAGFSVADASNPQRLRTFRSTDVKFQYPSTWRAHRFADNSSFSSLVVFLSNQRFRPPCVTHRHKRYTEVTCGQPIRRLQRGSILIGWWEDGFPLWSLRRVKGTPLKVGGRPAKLVHSPARCGVGEDTTLEVVIQSPIVSDNYDEMLACIRGPNSGKMEQQTMALLKTVRFQQAATEPGDR
jgi:hypothetical protein